MKAVILGTTGYTGMILLRLLADHPDVDQIIPVSSSRPGQPAASVDPGIGKSIEKKLGLCGGNLVTLEEAAAMKPDVVFAALPHLESAKICQPFFGKSVVIDLSADFRIKDHKLFAQAYGQEPPCPELLGQSVYGLCEIYSDQIKKADIIANPGCYPTCTLLPIIPLAKAGLLKGKIVANALSGISGSGRKAKVQSLFCERTENTCAYLPGQTHRHFTEILSQINSFSSGLDLFFTPHLVPLKRGMEVTTVIELAKPVTGEEVGKIYKDFYGDRPFVNLVPGTLPETKNVWGSNRCDISWQVQGSTILLFSVIDNLVKGASGQAVQNMNIRFGLEETAGLSLYGEL